jgi:GNAT superfamily N-acetyltransferase
MKRWLKALAHALLGEYAIYRVGRVQPAASLPVPAGLRMEEVQRATLEAAPEAELRASAWYLGDEARAFACYEQDRVVALACCWWGARYRARRSWPLPAPAVKLVHLVTLPAARGRGLAPVLIQHCEAALRAEGRAPLYARVWFNNEPSLRAFRRAGWVPVGVLVEVNPLRRREPWRFRVHL